MLSETKEALLQMANALQELNRALEVELQDMQKSGIPPSKVEHVRAGVKAIKDCGNMLLVWSDYIARGDLDDPTQRNEDEPDRGPDPFPR
jgi:uncharacterized membrane protein